MDQAKMDGKDFFLGDMPEDPAMDDSSGKERNPGPSGVLEREAAALAAAEEKGLVAPVWHHCRGCGTKMAFACDDLCLACLLKGVGDPKQYAGSAAKPPLGVMPERIWRVKRMRDLGRAVHEYLLKVKGDGDEQVVREWVEELERLLVDAEVADVEV